MSTLSARSPETGPIGPILCVAIDRRDGTQHMCSRSALYSLSAAGVLALAAGSEEVGFQDGVGAAVRFNYPQGIAVDDEGAVLIADTLNHALRRATRAEHGCAHTVCTIAGLGGVGGWAEGCGARALFSKPWGIVVDASGSLFVADARNHCVRRVAPEDRCGRQEWRVTTLAGKPQEQGLADGQNGAALFNSPQGLALHRSTGAIVVADCNNNCIRIIEDGRVTTTAGMGGNKADGYQQLNRPCSVACDAKLNVWVADRGNCRICRIPAHSGRVSTVDCQVDGQSAVAGGDADGQHVSAHTRLGEPVALALDAQGRLLVAEYSNPACLRLLRADLCWSFARILFIGLLTGRTCRGGRGGSGGEETVSADMRCAFSMLPVEGEKGLVCPILSRIIELVCVLHGFRG